jgi:hypothetical protein
MLTFKQLNNPLLTSLPIAGFQNLTDLPPQHFDSENVVMVSPDVLPIKKNKMGYTFMC